MDTKSAVSSKRQRSGSRTLAERARAQPGVEAVVEVYRQYRAVEKAVRPYMQAAQGRPLVSASDTSRPSRW